MRPVYSNIIDEAFIRIRLAHSLNMSLEDCYEEFKGEIPKDIVYLVYVASKILAKDEAAANQ